MFLGLTGGCKKVNNGNTTSQDLFPNRVGDHWQYLVKDTTIQGSQDNGSVQYDVNVQIVDTIKFANGNTATIWQFNYPGWIDTNFVYQSGDTIKFMDRTNSYLVRQYIFPFTTGSSWPYIQGIENVTVTGQGSITVGNNTFADAWHINGNAGLPDGIFSVDEWFDDHVGFVKKYYNPFGELIITKHIQDWSLVSYELK